MIELTDEKLLAYLDGDLTAEEKQEIEAHLAGNAALKNRLQWLKQLEYFVRDGMHLHLPERFEKPIMDYWRQRDDVNIQLNHSFFKSAHGIFAMISGAIILILLFVEWNFNGNFGQPEYIDFMLNVAPVKQLSRETALFDHEVLKSIMMNITLVLMAIIGLFILDTYVLKKSLVKKKGYVGLA
jgi:hypothetical protein